MIEVKSYDDCDVRRGEIVFRSGNGEGVFCRFAEDRALHEVKSSAECAEHNSPAAKEAARISCEQAVRAAGAEQKMKGESLANVDIDPANITLAELRTIFGDTGFVRSYLAVISSGGAVHNTRMVYWVLGPVGGVENALEHCLDTIGPTPRGRFFSAAVAARFLSPTDDIPNDARPIAIRIERPFAGSVRGLRVMDTESKIIGSVRSLRVTDAESKIIDLGNRAGFELNLPGVSIGRSISIGGGWEAEWNMNGSPQERPYIELRALSYN